MIANGCSMAMVAGQSRHTHHRRNQPTPKPDFDLPAAQHLTHAQGMLARCDDQERAVVADLYAIV